MFQGVSERSQESKDLYAVCNSPFECAISISRKAYVIAELAEVTASFPAEKATGFLTYTLHL